MKDKKDSRKNFAVMGNKGFHITFPNGVTLSTQIGGGNYCDNYDFPVGKEQDEDKMQCTNAEIAVWNNKKWITEEMCREIFPKKNCSDCVLGYINIIEWLQIIEWCVNCE